MNSGVYCLRFTDGSEYVGKSIDIERRLKEHAEKLRTGTAAKLLQTAYNKFGFPTYSVLIRCHADHIDLMETYYICIRQPILNAVGGIPVTNGDLKALEKYAPLLEHSTADHLNYIMQLNVELDKLNDKLKEYDKKYKELKEYLDKSKLETRTGLELASVKKELEEYEESYTKLVEEHQEVLNMSLWDRIFKWVK